MVGIDWKEQKGVSLDDGNVLCPDYWLYRCVYICQNSLKCTLNISAFHYPNFTKKRKMRVEP